MTRVLALLAEGIALVAVGETSGRVRGEGFEPTNPYGTRP